VSLRNSLNPLVVFLSLFCSVSLRKRVLRIAAIIAHVDAIKKVILTPWTIPCCATSIPATRAEGAAARYVIKYVREYPFPRFSGGILSAIIAWSAGM